MKKVLALTVLAASAAPVLAQSSVTIYGIADAGVTRVTGLPGGSRTDVVSGIMEGSRLGVRGNEDLGGGYRAIFTMENRTELDTGGVSYRPPSGSLLPGVLSSATALGLPGALQPAVNAVAASIGSTVGVNLAGNFWDRQIWAGLVTPVGAILAGRQYTPAYEVHAAFDTMHTESALAAGQIAAVPQALEIRTSNALAYRLQLGGVSAAAMYAFGEVAGSASANRLLSAMGMYKSGVFSVGAGYATRNNELGDKALTNVVLGASAQLGPGTLSSMLIKAKNDNPSGLSGISGTLTPVIGPGAAALVQNAFINAFRQDALLAHIGYRLTAGRNTVSLTYTRYDDKRPANADVTSYGVAYGYALSKRTDLNAVAARFDNKPNAQAAPGNAGYVGGFTASPGTDSTSLSLGIRHRF